MNYLIYYASLSQSNRWFFVLMII